MARVRLSVDFDINEEALKEKGVSFDTVLDCIKFYNHDVIDGFEITTDIPGCDCTSDFFLEDGEIAGIEVLEAPAKNRLEKIIGYKDTEEFLKKANEQKLADETDILVSQIRALKPRIDELIELGNACLKNGIDLEGSFNWGHPELYEESHKFLIKPNCHNLLGFVCNVDSNEINFLGINGPQVNGIPDLRTDGNKVFSVYANTELKENSAEALRKFLSDFDVFETAFYNYVDIVVEKQQNAVDKIISDAAQRSEKTDTGDAGKNDIVKE